MVGYVKFVMKKFVFLQYKFIVIQAKFKILKLTVFEWIFEKEEIKEIVNKVEN